MESIKSLFVAIMVTFICTGLFGCRQEQTLAQGQQKLTGETKSIEKPQPPQKDSLQAAPQNYKKKPRIEVKNPVHDFGGVAPNTSYKCQFEFENVGDGILKIDKIDSTCGCSVPKIEKKQYDPGESGVVEVKFQSPSKEGATTKHLYIRSNDKENPKAELAIKATVELKVVVSPNKMELSLDKENAGIGPITIKSKDGQAFSIKSFIAPNSAITAEFDPELEQTEFVLNPKVDMQQLKKSLDGSINIKVSHPESGRISVTYSTKPMFELSNSRIFLKSPKAGEPIIREVSVISNYGSDFEIESITSQNQLMKVLSQKKEENRIILEIQITPPAQQKSKVIKDSLRIKVKDAGELEVNCYGWYGGGGGKLRKGTADRSNAE